MDSPTIALVSIMTNRMLINVRRQGEKNQLAPSSVGPTTFDLYDLVSYPSLFSRSWVR